MLADWQDRHWLRRWLDIVLGIVSARMQPTCVQSCGAAAGISSPEEFIQNTVLADQLIGNAVGEVKIRQLFFENV